jgi:DNA-binding PadR family transcriptional regulator
MSLPHTLLGLIYYRPATGYEINATFSRSVNFFWKATLPQIYKTLTQMEKKGWLQVTTEHQDGKPSRKVYSITDEGLSEFRRWLTESVPFSGQNNPMLPKVFFGKQLDPDRLLAHLAEWRDYHQNILDRLRSEGKSSIEKSAANPKRAEDVTYWRLTMDFGLMRCQMVVDWCNHAMAVLKEKNPSGGAE